MDDGEDDMGSTTTSETELDFSPEQLAAQRLGLNVLEGAMPNQEMQIRRALALLQPAGADAAQGARESVAGPIRRATGLARSALGTGLESVGLPRTSVAPLLDNLGNIDRETLNAARAQIIDRYMSGSPIQMFRPDIGRFLLEPNRATQTSSTEQGSGAQTMQAIGLAVGVAAIAAVAI